MFLFKNEENAPQADELIKYDKGVKLKGSGI